jgi:FAD dependent oxidoreductase TIGR03364
VGARFDLAVVGAGILGLAHAYAGLRRGLSVVVVDREAEAVGASVRNFGFVTVTGQAAGESWRRAMRSRDVWAEVAPQAGIAVEQVGALVVARRPEAMRLIEAFAATAMGAACTLLDAAEARRRHGAALAQPLAGALWSPHELRVESRTAIGRLAAWLEAQGVAFRRRTAVRAVRSGCLDTGDGPIAAERIVVCPGDDLATLFPEHIRALGVTRCRLQMLKVRPEAGFRLPGAVMSDLSLVRYAGFAALPEAAALRARLEAEQPAELANGVHLIAVQGGEGDLVVGDSHHYGWSPSPFSDAAVDDLMLAELHAVLRLPTARVVERWSGTYASLPDRPMIREAPEDGVRLVIVTSGSGASTGFAIAEETLDDLL